MKSVKSKGLIALVLTLALAFNAQIAQAADTVIKAIASQARIMVNGSVAQLDKPPVNIDGSIYLSVRSINETLDKKVGWDAATKTVTIQDYPLLAGKYTWKNPCDLGQGLQEGGFSGMTHLPGDPGNVFYVVADRGPNGQIVIDKASNRTYPTPDYDVRFYKVQVDGNEIKILDTIKLQLPNGKIDAFTKDGFLSGVSNIATDEKSYDYSGKTLLALDPDGLDLEGIAYSPSDDTFWLSDEYRPALIQVSRTGTVLKKIVPIGDKAKLADAQSPIVEAIPAIYAKRIANRGFEGVTVSPDGKFLYASIQSPMAVPDKATGEASRNLRILKMNLATGTVVGEYVYVAEDATKFVNVFQKDVVISDISAVATDILLIDERDKNEGAAAQLKRIYKFDLSKATNILGTPASANIEAIKVEQFKENAITPPAKELVLDLTKFDYPFEKFEGLTVVNKNTIAIANDNDFGVGEYNSDGVLQTTGKQTQIWIFEVKKLW